MADKRGNTSQQQGNVAHDEVDQGLPLKIGGRAQDPTQHPDEVADDDRVDGLFDRNGRLGVWPGVVWESASINVSSLNDNLLVNAQAGKRMCIWNYLIQADGTTDWRFMAGTGGPGTAYELSGQMPYQAREGAAIGGGFHPLMVVGAGTPLILELSAAINVHGHLSYSFIDD